MATRTGFWSDWLTADSDGQGKPCRSSQAVPGMEPEAYALAIRLDGITIKAGSTHGVSHGLTTLRLALTRKRLPCGDLVDAPRFAHRGLLDCCQHFMEPEFVKRTIDLLALHKMSVLHWHLTEDQGWRVEIDAYPELTQKGALRTEADGSQHGGFTPKSKSATSSPTQPSATSSHSRNRTPGPQPCRIGRLPVVGVHRRGHGGAARLGRVQGHLLRGAGHDVGVFENRVGRSDGVFPSNTSTSEAMRRPKCGEQCLKCQKRIADEGLHDAHELQSWFIGEIGRYRSPRAQDDGWDEPRRRLPDGATVQSWRGMDGGRDAVAMGHDAIMSPTSHCYFDTLRNPQTSRRSMGFLSPSRRSQGTAASSVGVQHVERTPQHLLNPRCIRASWRWLGVWSPPSTRNWPDFQTRMNPITPASMLGRWQMDGKRFPWRFNGAGHVPQRPALNSFRPCPGLEARENLWLLAVKQRPVPWPGGSPRFRVRANCGGAVAQRRIDGRPVFPWPVTSVHLDRLSWLTKSTHTTQDAAGLGGWAIGLSRFSTDRGRRRRASTWALPCTDALTEIDSLSMQITGTRMLGFSAGFCAVPVVL